MTAAPVYINVYDLAGESWISSMGVKIYHSAIEVYGREYGYGGSDDDDTSTDEGAQSGLFTIYPGTYRDDYLYHIKLGEISMTIEVAPRGGTPILPVIPPSTSAVAIGMNTHVGLLLSRAIVLHLTCLPLQKILKLNPILVPRPRDAPSESHSTASKFPYPVAYVPGWPQSLMSSTSHRILPPPADN